jgi:hypothetical protein
MEFQNALTVCPDNILPEASVTVPEIMSGSFLEVSLKACSTANKAALQFKGIKYCLN